MSNRPFFAARLELFLDRRLEQLFRAFGWQERVIAYTAYGDEGFARVLGRVVLSPPFAQTVLGQAAEQFLRRRGWRTFFTAACVHARYTITLGDAEVTGTTDRGGYVDHRLRGHGLGPGWQAGTIRTATSQESVVQAQVVGSDVRFGMVSATPSMNFRSQVVPVIRAAPAAISSTRFCSSTAFFTCGERTIYNTDALDCTTLGLQPPPSVTA